MFLETLNEEPRRPVRFDRRIAQTFNRSRSRRTNSLSCSGSLSHSTRPRRSQSNSRAWQRGQPI